MTSPKLAILQRQMERRTPEKIPAPASDDLAAAIERLVQERVDEALEQRPVKPPAHVQRITDQFDVPKPYTDFRQIPPTPRTQPPTITEMTIERDGAGVARFVNVNGSHGAVRMLIQRDASGRMLRMIPADQASVVTYDGKPVPAPKGDR